MVIIKSDLSHLFRLDFWMLDSDTYVYPGEIVKVVATIMASQSFCVPLHIVVANTASDQWHIDFGGMYIMNHGEGVAILDASSQFTQAQL